ncbi:MAG: glycoside hydrolase family 3 C-terminal domain-containing protein [Propionibacteriaceae bacterium]|jgi:beta-glucosidase|nr:glycoside hydrolase family 3 C-terminal domain-containing protein [Propionibacteriaceae bacterium]
MNKFSESKIIRWAGWLVPCILGVIALVALVWPDPLGYNVRFTAALVRNLAIIAAVWIIAATVFRAVKHKHIAIVGTILLSLALLVVMILNIAVGALPLLVNQLLGRTGVTISADLATSSKDMTYRLEAEGLVLLKNDGDALPLKDDKVNVFGYSAGLIVYGGSGSGSSDESKNVTLNAALAQAGLSVNTELSDFYAGKNGERAQGSVLNMLGGDYSIPEIAPADIDSGVLDRAKTYSDTALLVISRNGGEGADMPLDMAGYAGGKAGTHYLQLTDDESALVAYVSENFGNVVVLVNSSSPMNLGFLDDSGVKAALWIGGPGSTGLNAVADALVGKVNPSGRLADIYPYDVTSSPAFFNTGSFSYLNSEHEAGGITALFGAGASTYNFNNYAEGIYIGYRYYETAAADGFIDYGKTVQFPFGYGLSYTTFEQTMGDVKASGGQLSVDVTVTNRGNVAGKDVVQVYNGAPYTKGGIEKASVVLLAFDKTDVLQPGQSQTLSLTFAVEDLGSYDYKSAKGYVVEAGDYNIQLMKNSHEVIDSRVYSVNTAIHGRNSDQTEAVNRFDDAAGDVTYLSRADWAGTMPTAKTVSRPITPEILAQLEDTSIDVDTTAPDIVYKDNNLTLADMAGLAYDDPKWELFLQQLSVSDMEALIGSGGWQTVRIPSIGKPQTIEIDGPAGVNGLIGGQVGTQFTSAVVAAATFNQGLIEEFGEAMGKEANALKVSGLYAPAVNTHRTPFSGRNFEYYSEDPLLSGKMGAAMVRGLNKTGTYAYVKHFALDDQETNMVGLTIWSNEQAIREVYLKSFEIVVKEGNAQGIMSSWNRIGTRWTGANKALLTDVLRNEWGFVGAVITDNAMMGTFMDPDQAIEAGNDMMLNIMSMTFDSPDSAYGLQNMRNASHDILFVQANGHAVDYARPGTPMWIWIFTIVDAGLLFLIWLGFKKASGEKKPKKPKKGKAVQESVEAA